MQMPKLKTIRSNISKDSFKNYFVDLVHCSYYSDTEEGNQKYSNKEQQEAIREATRRALNGELFYLQTLIDLLYGKLE